MSALRKPATTEKDPNSSLYFKGYTWPEETIAQRMLLCRGKIQKPGEIKLSPTNGLNNTPHADTQLHGFLFLDVICLMQFS